MTTRRGFIAGCSAAVAAYTGTRFNTLAFGDPGADGEVLVVLFLRGGMDAMNFVLPRGNSSDRGPYEAARPTLAVPLSGPNQALAVNGQLAVHPALDSPEPGAPGTLYDLYQDNKLSLVVATGMHEGNRSHFDSMNYMELGTPGQLTTGTGWLTRHLQACPLPSETIMPALAVGNLEQASLRGSLEAINMTDPDSFSLNQGPWEWRNAQRAALRNLYQGASPVQLAGTETLDAIDIIELNGGGGSYQPANGARYPNTSFGRHLQTIASMIKLDIGLTVATIDFGGWDTHNGQGNDGGGYFFAHLAEMARGLAAFYHDLDGNGANNYTNKMSVVMQSEFGRRLRQNADQGSDHGQGGVTAVLSGNATGGVHGTWPGLDNQDLFDGADLQVTTDFRQVLSEILIRRMGNNNLGIVFPGYNGYAPLGVVNGVDTPPVYGPGIFNDNFESGTLSAWS